MVELYLAGMACCFLYPVYCALSGEGSISDRIGALLLGTMYAVMGAPVWPLVLVWYLWTKHKGEDFL